MRRLVWLWCLVIVCLLGGPLPVRAAQTERGPVPVSASDPSWGRSDAPVTIVVFADLQCPFCQRQHATLEKLKSQYGPRRLRIVYKHFPLAFHKEARPAAEAADAVRRLKGNDAFWQFIDKSYDLLVPARDGHTHKDVLAALGLDARAVARLVKGGKPGKKVDADIALGEEIGVKGTPASFVNGVRLSGARSLEDFVDAVDEQLDAAKRLARGRGDGEVYVELAKKNYAAPAVRSKTSAPSAAQPAPDTTTVWNVPVGRSPVLGPKNAPVTLVVFTDLQCPFCSRLQPVLRELARRYPSDLAVVVKHNPLSFHQRAEPAAQLAIEAQTQKGDAAFFSAIDKLFGTQKNLEDSDLERVASELGLDAARAMRAVKSHAHARVIEADQELAEDVDANGTPTSFINGRRLGGALPVESFAAIIEEEIASAKRLALSGVAATALYAHIIKDGRTAPVAERKIVPAPGAKSPSRGPAAAKVTIQMFTDFQCPFCGRVQETLAAIEKELGSDVRVVFRHMPLDFHAGARPAHEAALEAFKQGGNKAFWKMNDLLYGNQRSFDRESLLALGKEAGLDVKELTAALDSGRHLAAIDADMKIAEKAAITGTPAFVINGYFISGSQPLGKFRRVIRRALADAKGGAKP